MSRQAIRNQLLISDLIELTSKLGEKISYAEANNYEFTKIKTVELKSILKQLIDKTMELSNEFNDLNRVIQLLKFQNQISEDILHSITKAKHKDNEQDIN